MLANEFVAFITFLCAQNQCLFDNLTIHPYFHTWIHPNVVCTMGWKFFLWGIFISIHLWFHMIWVKFIYFEKTKNMTKSPTWFDIYYVDFVKFFWPIHKLWSLQLFVKCPFDKSMKNWDMSLVKTKNISIKMLLQNWFYHMWGLRCA